MKNARLLFAGSSLVERMYHSATLIGGDRVAVIGGRTSPTKPCRTLCLLHFQPDGDQDTFGAKR